MRSGEREKGTNKGTNQEGVRREPRTSGCSKMDQGRLKGAQQQR